MDFKTGTLRVSKYFLILSIAALPQLASAAITACPTTAGTDVALSTLQNAGVAAANFGCSNVNVSFENVSFLGATATGGGVAQTTANNQMFSTGTAALNNTIGPVAATFDPSGTNWTITSGGGSTAGATIGYEAISHTGPTVPYGASPTTVTDHWDFSTITLTPTGSITGGLGTSSVSVVMKICLSASTTSACTAAQTATVTGLLNTTSTTFNYTCVAGASFAGTCGGATSQTVTLNATRPSFVAISDTYTINRSTGVNVNLTNFTNSFGEVADTPEPSTFVLLSGALLGLGTLTRKRRKA